MDRKKLGKRALVLILFIFVVNFLTNLFHWDYSIWWWDMFLHFLGGFWLALAAFWFLEPQNLDSRLILKVISVVLVVGVGWEIYEVVVNETFAKFPFSYVDSASDLFFDLAGGTLATLYYVR